MKNTPIAVPTSAEIKNLCLLETPKSQMSARTSSCESLNPRKPKLPYRIIIMTALSMASTGVEAGSSCSGKIGKKELWGKKTLIATKIARIMMRQIYILTDRDISSYFHLHFIN